MDKKEVITKLLKAQKAIRAALDAMEYAGSEVAAESKQNYDLNDVAQTCVFCKKPIPPNQRSHRGMHSACYHFANDRVNRREITWEELQKQGLALPPARGGRKKKSLPKIAQDPEKYTGASDAGQKKGNLRKRASHEDESHT